MRKLGIIDIGSNSIRLVIVQIRTNGSFKIMDELKESVRLGEKTNGADVLNHNKIAAAIDTLKMFRNLCDALDVQEMICVATEAVRRASNQSALLELVQEQLGLTIRVISGMEEAYYDYFGAVNTLNLPDGIIMDIGGSSTELILVKNKQLEKSVSLPFGAITLAQMFQMENRVSEQNRKGLQRFLLEHFSQIDWIRGEWQLIGIGGSFRNIAKIDRKLKNYPLDVAHNYPLSVSSLLNISDMLNELSIEERKNIRGLSKDRADIFPGALAAIVALTEAAGITDILISGSGLREGILYEYLLQERQPIEDVLDFSLQNIMNNYELNHKHARHVWGLSRQLYDQLQQGLRIEKDRHKILKTAALLHDCGINISYYDHHKHSFYMILNSRVNGLTHKELIMAAWVAACHRKDEVKITFPYRTMLSSEEISTVQKLGILLRIAESLDRRQNGNVYQIESNYNKESVSLKVLAKENASLEIKDVLSITSSFQKVFKRQLVLEES